MNDEPVTLPEVPVPALPEVTGTDLTEIAVALAFVVGAIVLAWLIVLVLSWLTRRVASATGHPALGDVLVDALRVPTRLLIALQGVFVGLRVLSFLEPHQAVVNRFWLTAVLLTAALAIHRLVRGGFGWYATHQSGTGASRVEPATLSRVRTGVSATIALLALLIALDTLGLEVAPLIAGLGIGGLAVALALQPVLSNVFASSYLLSDASIRVGDWVEIENGPAGLVQSIGFRATRIATFDNNMVLVPNATLANTTFTNFSAGNPEADARVLVGVAYEEDLERVEEVLWEELTAVRDASPSAIPGRDPVLLYQGFGDSNVDILLKVRAHTWFDSYQLRHLMVKRVHARLAREGITINYPARRLLMQEPDTTGFDRLVRRADGTNKTDGAGDDAVEQATPDAHA